MNLGRCVRVLLAGAVLATAPAWASAGQDWVNVRIVTINVKEGLIGPGSNAYDALSDMITTIDQDPNDGATGLNPDIVCFQELDRGATGDLTTFRDQFLPGYQIFADVSGGDFTNYNAVLVAPDITVVSTQSINTPGPRNTQALVFDIPGSPEFLKLYAAHFKAFTDGSSTSQRTGEANQIGNAVASDLSGGFVGGVPVENQHVIVAGDLNSNSNFDGSLDGLYETEITIGTCCAPADGSADANFMQFLGVDCSGPDPCCVDDIPVGFCNSLGGIIQETSQPTGLVDLVYESLRSQDFSGTGITATFDNGFRNSRLDYINVSESLALRFDADMDGLITGFDPSEQEERNAIGFVYYANENPNDFDPGQFANGNTGATILASDHLPVVATFRFLPDVVEPVVGACCLADGMCVEVAQADCDDAGGVYEGDETDCSGADCPQPNACQFDFNNDGSVDGGDFGDFGAAFGSMVGDASYAEQADSNSDGVVDGADFGDFGAEFGRTDCLD